MALTMTRTRTQEALNKLAHGLAEVNGELEFLASLVQLRKDRQALADARRAELERVRDAFFIVIKRYDPDLKPEQIGESYGWRKPFGRKATARTVRRYFQRLTAVLAAELR